MDQKQLRKLEALCIQDEPPACQAGCPMNVDCRAFIDSMKTGDLRKARTFLDKTIGLANLVGHLCEAPCEQYCLRSGLGGSIAVSLLEHHCVTENSQPGKLLPLPAKSKRVAVLGSGPSSLMAAFDLAKKGYPVKVYYTGNTPGSWLTGLPEQRLPAQVLQQEVERLEKLRVTFEPVDRLDHTLCLPEVADAFFIGQDDGLENDTLDTVAICNKETMQCERPDVFTGGCSRTDHAYRFITDIAQGKEAAVSIDRYLQGASLTASRRAPRNGKTELYTNTSGVTPQTRIVPSASDRFTADEAKAEAARCIGCQCMECVNHCVYLQEFEGYPRSYARRIYNNSAIVKGTHLANTLINSCSLCGQCEELCPNDFSMANLCHEARTTMVRENRMPPSAYWFGLEEMRSARTEGALALHAPGHTSSRTLFFPGCQLAGIRPTQTALLYQQLRKREPQTGIWLDCCGIPANWAGEQSLFQDTIGEIGKTWENMGNPTILTGCPTCLKMFREHLPQTRAELVWSCLSVDAFPKRESAEQLALSDPCSTRKDDDLQHSVRQLLADIGQPLAPLAMSGPLTECCGFGGGMASANPDLARKTAQRRGEQTEETMLTYCAMCRDQLARGGKQAIHLLDLMFPERSIPPETPPVHISERRINRRKLQSELLSLYPDHQQPEVPSWEQLEIEIPEAVRNTMETRRILEDDIKKVLEHSIEQEEWLEQDETGLRIVSARLGEVTFWVEYRIRENCHHICRCWSHRMRITGGDR